MPRPRQNRGGRVTARWRRGRGTTEWCPLRDSCKLHEAPWKLHGSSHEQPWFRGPATLAQKLPSLLSIFPLPCTGEGHRGRSTTGEVEQPMAVVNALVFFGLRQALGDGIQNVIGSVVDRYRDH